MSLDQWTLIYNAGLVVLIVFTVSMLAIMAFRKAWYWFTVFSGIAGCVVAGEAVSFIVLKKSISAQYGDWLHADPFWALAGLVCFVLAMSGLVVHLWAGGERNRVKARQKKDGE